MHISIMLVFWFLVRNNVVLAVYLLFSVACFFTVHEPSFWFLLMTRVIGSLQVFDIVYTLTKGGPSHSTETLVTYVYDKAFVSSTRMGYATAMSEFLFLIIMILTIVQYVIMNKTKD